MPATLTDVNVAAADMGGAVEELTGSYGPGLTGRRLVDGLLSPTWIVPSTWTWNSRYWVKYPVEAVLSFYERQPALVGAVTIVRPEAASAARQDPDASIAAPKDVEVWISKDSPIHGYVKVAEQAMAARPGDQTITFPAAEVRFVKIRILSGTSQRELEIAEVRVLEAARAGYVPLFTRVPDSQSWKGSPREAAQRSLDWLQQAASNWRLESSVMCFGCHVQAQALMGQTVALKEGYRVSMPAMRELSDFIREKESPGGTWSEGGGGGHCGGVRGHGPGECGGGARGRRRSKASESGGLPVGAAGGGRRHPRGPLRTADPPGPVRADGQCAGSDQVGSSPFQGSEVRTGGRARDRVDVHSRARDHPGQGLQDHLADAVRRAGAEARGLVGGGSTRSRTAARWRLEGSRGSNAFATGQVLYAFKQAGVSVQSEKFRRGVEYLLKTQVNEPTASNGSWKAVHTQSERKSDFAPTMWAVIGLANAYGAAPTGALQVVRQGDKSAGHNLEIVLDVSGSMNTSLGPGTRWTTALQVLKEVVASLPGDLNVGLRVYGHRYPSKSAQTCQDTELVVPIGKLDRDRIINATSQLKPRGETPLVRSVLKTVGDLKAVGGGSVILITDGEESCKGNAKSAAREIKASGVNVTLNIVGFTLTGKATEAELGAFAGSTGGHYYGAQDGEQLARAVKLAALQRLPYDVLDGSGKVVASGETSSLSRELPPGPYRIRIEALGQKLEAPVTVVADETTAISLGVEGDRFVVRR